MKTRIELQEYLSVDGKCPFEDWFGSLKDIKTRAVIRARLNRIILGNLGDCKSVGKGVFEFRINYGPGYRIYFGKDGLRLIILLCGGSKSSQNRDIRQAKSYWADYCRRKNEQTDKKL
ncbi:type II toxin-antitoxin system RelE/ParE family toxin [candidate division KSB1 bacterium]|nr:type II toxin-antitoxin system RelE/ParE family toxin [candidate division KSB1 bacterium]